MFQRWLCVLSPLPRVGKFSQDFFRSLHEVETFGFQHLDYEVSVVRADLATWYDEAPKCLTDGCPEQWKKPKGWLVDIRG